MAEQNIQPRFWLSVTALLVAAIVATGILHAPAAAAPGDVSIIALSCDSSPEYVRIKNFGGSSQSLSNFFIQSDPSQSYHLALDVASISAGQILEFQSGAGSADNPGAGIYSLTGSFIYRNGDTSDYARLLRSDATAHQVNCGSTPSTPAPGPTAAPTPVPGNGKLQIHHIDAEQGDAALIISPNGQRAMVDDGRWTNCSNIINYLQARGISTIDYHFATHYDADHIGCLDDMAAAGIVVSVACYDRGSAPATITGEFTAYTATCGAKRQTLSKNQVVTLDQGSVQPVRITVVDLNGAGVYSGSEENALGVVLLVRFGAFDEVVGGDLPGASPDIESAVAPQVADVEVYKVHHHGSATSSNDNWLNGTTPEVGILSVGANPYGHPTADHLGRLHAHGVKTYWTNTGSGAAPDPTWDKVGGTIVVNADPGIEQGYVVSGSGFSDIYSNSSESADFDGDGVNTTDEINCGSNPNHPGSRPERMDTGGDDDGDTLVNEALPPGAQAHDCDGDGYVGTAEAHVGTSDQDPCGGSGWPSDLYTSTPGGFQYNTLNIQDLGTFLTPVRRFGTSPGNPDFDPRWDLVPGGTIGGTINVQDVAATITAASGYPPMLAGERAFGKVCAYPP
jgi:beta-lactamase superfamily II metal-dependent hydrolase